MRTEPSSGIITLRGKRERENMPFDFIPCPNQTHRDVSSKSEYGHRKGFLLRERSPLAAQVLQWYLLVLIQSGFQFPKNRDTFWKIMPLAVLGEDFSSPVNYISPHMHSSSVNLISPTCHFTIPSILIKLFF